MIFIARSEGAAATEQRARDRVADRPARFISALCLTTWQIKHTIDSCERSGSHEWCQSCRNALDPSVGARARHEIQQERQLLETPGSMPRERYKKSNDLQHRSDNRNVALTNLRDSGEKIVRRLSNIAQRLKVISKRTCDV